MGLEMTGHKIDSENTGRGLESPSVSSEKLK